jgi:hypothetical protein
VAVAKIHDYKKRKNSGDKKNIWNEQVEALR